MGAIYWKADATICARVQSIMERWHPALVEANLKVDIVMSCDKSGEACVKHGGYPARATISVVPLKDRLSKGDVELILCAVNWKDSCDLSKDALIDHELMHLEPKREKVKTTKKGRDDDDEEDDGDDGDAPNSELGPIVTDDLGRPVIKLRKGDWNGGDGFREVAIRHGQYALEVHNHRDVQNILDQCAVESKALAS